MKAGCSLLRMMCLTDIPSRFFFDKGYGYYVNGRCKILRKLSLCARFAQTIYIDKSETGGVPDLIK